MSHPESIPKRGHFESPNFKLFFVFLIGYLCYLFNFNQL